MEAPERIWIAPVHGATRPDDFYLIDPEYRNGRGVEYIRADLHRAEVDALVAGAYEAAADAISNLPENGRAGPPQDNTDRLLDAQKRADASAIRALTPDDARAALRAHTEAAVRRALEAAAAACRKQAEQFKSDEYATGQPMSSFSERFGCAQCEDAIRALDPAQFIGGNND